MNSTNYTRLVKRAIGVAGFVIAGTAALPAVAQLGSTEVETPMGTVEVKPSMPGVPGTMTPAETVSPEAETPATESSTTPTAEAETPASKPSATPEAEAPATGTSTTPATGAEAPATPGTPSPRLAATSGTIVDVASASDSFQTLVAALTEAELAEVLQGEGPFTVFAPTDEAFAALPEGTVEELLKPANRETLVQLLKYHVVPGALMSTDLSSGEVTTVQGGAVEVTVAAGKVTVNDANVIQADIPASNGVIHAIDRVILPPATASQPETQPGNQPGS